MPRHVPTTAELRARLDARLADAEQAMRDAADTDAIPEDLRTRARALRDQLISLRRELEGEP